MEEPAPANLKLKNLSEYIGFSLAFILILSMISRMVYKSNTIGDGSSLSALEVFFSLLIYTICMGGGIKMLRFFLKEKPYVWDKQAYRPYHTSLCIALVGINLFVGAIIQPVVKKLTGGIPVNFNVPDDVGGLLLYVITVCVVGPVFEELIFRGYILGSLKPYGNTFAVVVSAVLFAIMHGNLVQGIPTFFCGLILGFAYVKYESIYAVIKMHILVNTTMTGMQLAAQHSMSTLPAFTIIEIMAFFAILHLVKKVSVWQKFRRLDYKMIGSFFCTIPMLLFAAVWLIKIIYG